MGDPSGRDKLPFKMGTVNTYVKAMQAKLNALLNLNPRLASDGIFGAATEEAVKAFQRNVGLEPDGIIGPLTFDAMFPTPVWSPPARHRVYLYSQQEVVNRANLAVGAPVIYHLEYPNGGTDPTAPMPCDEQTGYCDCSGFNAWVQGFDRDFLDGMSDVLDAWDGYANTDSKIDEARREGKLFSIIPIEDAVPGDMLVAESYRTLYLKRRIGHEGTITAVGNVKRDGLKALNVVHCSSSNHKAKGNNNKSAIWKTTGELWGTFKKWYVIRFNKEYAIAKYQKLAG